MNTYRKFVPLAALRWRSCLRAADASRSHQRRVRIRKLQMRQRHQSGCAVRSQAAARVDNLGPSAFASLGAGIRRRHRQPAVVELPAGTSFAVRLDQDLGSKISQSGDSFTATVADDVIVNGQTVIPRGARADGTVINAKALGQDQGRSCSCCSPGTCAYQLGQLSGGHQFHFACGKGQGQAHRGVGWRRRWLWRACGRVGRRRKGRSDWRTGRRRRRNGRRRFHGQQADLSACRNAAHFPTGKFSSHHGAEVESVQSENEWPRSWGEDSILRPGWQQTTPGQLHDRRLRCMVGVRLRCCGSLYPSPCLFGNAS